MKRLLYIFLLLILGGQSFGQGVVDALRLSRMQYLGTARFNAMGGSFGALGGEASGLAINPAGIGVYRNSEFTFSTGLLSTFQEAGFRNTLNEESTFNFNIPNISFVNSYRGDPGGWKNYSFTFSHNRVNSYRNSYRFNGRNNESSSFVDPYELQYIEAFPNAEDLPSNYNILPFGPAQAFETFAIDTFPDGNGGYFIDRWLFDEESIDQNMEVDEAGRQTETFFGFGGNYQDRLYLGANLGIQSTRFERDVIRYEEYNYNRPPLSSGDISSYSEETNLLSLGTGFNFKIGMIYRITEQLRIGAAVHSPTWFRFSEEYIVRSNSSFSDGIRYDSEFIESNYEYRLRTPWRFNGSLAYVIGKLGMVNVDYEFVDYSSARFDNVRNSEFSFSLTNNQISEQLQTAHTIRFGGEVRLDPFVARAGLRYESNPFANNTDFNPDESRITYSLGTGYRFKNFNFDLAYSISEMNFIDPFYATSPEAADIVRTDHLVTATFGWRW